MDKWNLVAVRPEMGGGVQFHIRCKQGDIAKYVLLPGDPERVNVIADEWTESRPIADFRGHRPLVEACERPGVRYHVGVGCSTASWYGGQGRPGFNGY